MEKSSATLKSKLEIVPAALGGAFYCIVGAAFLVVVIVCMVVGRKNV